MPIAPADATMAEIEQLIRFDTTSRESNLALIDHVVARLAAVGVEPVLVPSPDGAKANLLATFPAADGTVTGGIVLSAHTDVVPVDGQAVQVGCSMGVVMYPRDGDDPKTLMMNADAAMYRAKELGKNNCQFYAQEMNASLEEKLALMEGLRRAVDELSQSVIMVTHDTSTAVYADRVLVCRDGRIVSDLRDITADNLTAALR